MTRPLTELERKRLATARSKIEAARRELRTVVRDVYGARGRVADIASAAGISRTQLYSLVSAAQRGEGRSAQGDSRED